MSNRRHQMRRKEQIPRRLGRFSRRGNSGTLVAGISDGALVSLCRVFNPAPRINTAGSTYQVSFGGTPRDLIPGCSIDFINKDLTSIFASAATNNSPTLVRGIYDTFLSVDSDIRPGRFSTDGSEAFIADFTPIG